MTIPLRGPASSTVARLLYPRQCRACRRHGTSGNERRPPAYDPGGSVCSRASKTGNPYASTDVYGCNATTRASTLPPGSESAPPPPGRQLWCAREVQMPMYAPGVGGGQAPCRFDVPNMPNYAWPSYSPYPNYASVTYPRRGAHLGHTSAPSILIRRSRWDGGRSRCNGMWAGGSLNESYGYRSQMNGPLRVLPADTFQVANAWISANPQAQGCAGRSTSRSATAKAGHRAHGGQKRRPGAGSLQRQ